MLKRKGGLYYYYVSQALAIKNRVYYILEMYPQNSKNKNKYYFICRDLDGNLIYRLSIYNIFNLRTNIVVLDDNTIYLAVSYTGMNDDGYFLKIDSNGNILFKEDTGYLELVHYKNYIFRYYNTVSTTDTNSLQCYDINTDSIIWSQAFIDFPVSSVEYNYSYRDSSSLYIINQNEFLFVNKYFETNQDSTPIVAQIRDIGTGNIINKISLYKYADQLTIATYFDGTNILTTARQNNITNALVYLQIYDLSVGYKSQKYLYVYNSNGYGNIFANLYNEDVKLYNKFISYYYDNWQASIGYNFYFYNNTYDTIINTITVHKDGYGVALLHYIDDNNIFIRGASNVYIDGSLSNYSIQDENNWTVSYLGYLGWNTNYITIYNNRAYVSGATILDCFDNTNGDLKWELTDKGLLK